MFKKNKNFIFAFDIYRISAEINTFNGDNKTKGGLVVSFIFIALSILYILYVLINYFEYSSPSVIYFKENEQDTNRTIDMKDPFLFGIFDNSDLTLLNESDFIFESLYIKYDPDDIQVYPLNIEKCQYNKNIDIKYKDKLSNYIVEDLYCFADDLTNYPLYYSSKDEYSEILISIKINENITNTTEDFLLGIINSNNVVNHMKTNPFSDIYYTSVYSDFSRTKYSIINYYFQYIKYESDRGIIIERIHTYNGKVFSSMDITRRRYGEDMDPNEIASIFIGINNINFDYYSRSYQRFQLQLVEIYWYVDIILLIGRIISKIFIEKEASIDIVKYLITKNIIEKPASKELSVSSHNNNQQKESIFKENINIKNNSQQKEPIFNEKINIKNDKSNYLDNKIKQPDNKSKNLDNNDEINETNLNFNIAFNDSSSGSKLNVDDKRINVLNSLNYYHILKSRFCFNDDKTKLINYCNALVTEEISIERVLRRMNDMEEKINCIINQLNGNNDLRIDKFDEINELIDKIDKNNTKKNCS
jgi:hypothetical protein